MEDLIARLRTLGHAVLADIVAAVERDPRRGWLAIDSVHLSALVGDERAEAIDMAVVDYVVAKGVRIVYFPAAGADVIDDPPRGREDVGDG